MAPRVQRGAPEAGVGGLTPAAYGQQLTRRDETTVAAGSLKPSATHDGRQDEPLLSECASPTRSGSESVRARVTTRRCSLRRLQNVPTAVVNTRRLAWTAANDSEERNSLCTKRLRLRFSHCRSGFRAAGLRHPQHP